MVPRSRRWFGWFSIAIDAVVLSGSGCKDPMAIDQSSRRISASMEEQSTSVPNIWVLLPFAAVAFDSAMTGSMSQFASSITLGLFARVLSLVFTQGEHRLITLSPLGVAQLLGRSEFGSHRTPSPVVINGHPLSSPAGSRCEPAATTEAH